ncbi:MAG: glycosyltransferase [Candidatus Caldatribacterium sp.]|nr:glycosyltransferase [Candidatus Caldatribacterium sp.]
MTLLREKVVYFSTYPPTECGLATFTRDLALSVASQSLVPPSVIAIEQGGEETSKWPSEVVFVVRKNQELDYVKAAKIANDIADIVSVQHEFGIFGGEEGEFVLTFLKTLKKKAVVTLHTILPKPDPKKQAIIQEMSQYVASFVCMNSLAIPILEQVYGIPAYKITYIPHGAPSEIPKDRERIRKELGLSEHIVLATFGLLGPGKGIEYAIEALPRVVRRFPKTIYLILGETHPKERERRGEAYRTFLEERVHELGLEDHVRFVNRYLSLEELADYLAATDIYITPYLNPEQITSGTLTYALHFGKVVISTPYLSAQEALQNGRGILVPFRNAKAIEEALLDLLGNPRRMETLQREVENLGDFYSWARVGKEYASLFAQLAQGYSALSLR